MFITLTSVFFIWKADDAQEAIAAFSEDTNDHQLLMNVEYKGASVDLVIKKCTAIVAPDVLMILYDSGVTHYERIRCYPT